MTSSPPCSARRAPVPGAPAARTRTEGGGKTLLASVRKPIAQVIADAFAEADRRDPDRARPWIAVVDGNNAQIAAITALAAERKVKIPVLIDFIHVVQYLWKAAGSFFDPGEPGARAWVKEQADKILSGKHRDVRAGIRRAPPLEIQPAERAGPTPARTTCRTSRATWTTPPSSPPWPSPAASSRARTLARQGPHAGHRPRWSLDGAEAVLRLRALEGNGDFDDYFTFHREQDKQRNHDSRYQQPQSQAA